MMLLSSREDFPLLLLNTRWQDRAGPTVVPARELRSPGQPGDGGSSC